MINDRQRPTTMRRHPHRADSVPKVLLLRPAALQICMLLLSGVVAGCGMSDEHADAGHMEHFVPEHKPANFAAAVNELAQRSEHLESHSSRDDALSRIELQELRDIVAWLPELAADSDLGEADWIEVQRQSRTIIQNQIPDPQLPAEVNRMVESLKPLVPRAGRPEPGIRHHDAADAHDHDSQDHDAHSGSDAPEEDHSTGHGIEHSSFTSEAASVAPIQETP